MWYGEGAVSGDDSLFYFLPATYANGWLGFVVAVLDRFAFAQLARGIPGKRIQWLHPSVFGDWNLAKQVQTKTVFFDNSIGLHILAGDVDRKKSNQQSRRDPVSPFSGNNLSFGTFLFHIAQQRGSELVDQPDDRKHAAHVRNHPALVLDDLENRVFLATGERPETRLVKRIVRVSQRIVHPDFLIAGNAAFRIVEHDVG